MELAQHERPNVDVALAWAKDAGEPVSGLRLLELLEMYWGTNDPVAGRARLDALLAVAGDEIDPETLARALRFRGATFDMTNRNDLAEPEYERAIGLLRSIGDEAEARHLTLRIANAAVRQGDLERASRLAKAALDADPQVALAVLSEVAFARENAEEGARLALGAADAASTAGFTWWRGVTLLGASEALLALGQLGKAGAFFPDGLDALRSVHDLVNLPIALGVGAALAAQLGDAARAGTLWGALEAEIDREPRATSVSAREGYEPYLEPVRSDVFEEARLRGRTLSLEDAVAYALGKQT